MKVATLYLLHPLQIKKNFALNCRNKIYYNESRRIKLNYNGKWDQIS